MRLSYWSPQEHRRVAKWKRAIVLGAVLAVASVALGMGWSQIGSTGSVRIPSSGAASAPEAAPRLIGSVSARYVTQTGANITWTTDEVAASQVECGTDFTYDLATWTDDRLVTDHSISLTGLDSDTTYYCRVVTADGNGGEEIVGHAIFTTLRDTDPPAISDVSVSDIAAGAVTVSWTTDEPSSGGVEYGPTSSYGQNSPLGSTPTTRHTVTIGGLAAGAEYHFRIRATDSAGNESLSTDGSFATIRPTLSIHFIDVGEGDSILIDCGETEVLIDGGEESSGIAGYLSDYVDGAIEVMVATHPHLDHIGGLIMVLEVFDVQQIWWNGDTTISPVYEEFAAAVEAEGAEIHTARRGDRITAGGLSFTVLNPAGLSDTVDNNSIVLSLSHGLVDFLFTGDVQQGAAVSMVESGIVPDVDILQVGHHGTASDPSLLETLQPAVAVYLAGTGTPACHPHTGTVVGLQGMGASILGTDVHGTIVITTDGDTYSIEVSNQQPD